MANAVGTSRRGPELAWEGARVDAAKRPHRAGVKGEPAARKPWMPGLGAPSKEGEGGPFLPPASSPLPLPGTLACRSVEQRPLLTRPVLGAGSVRGGHCRLRADQVMWGSIPLEGRPCWAPSLLFSTQGHCSTWKGRTQPITLGLPLPVPASEAEAIDLGPAACRACLPSAICPLAHAWLPPVRLMELPRTPN